MRTWKESGMFHKRPGGNVLAERTQRIEERREEHFTRGCVEACRLNRLSEWWNRHFKNAVI